MNPDTNTIKELFTQSSEKTEELKLQERVEKLEPRHQKQLYETVEQELNSLDNFADELNEDRDRMVKNETQRQFDRKRTEQELKLAPKELPTYSEKQLREAAQEDAEFLIDQNNEQRFSTAEALTHENILNTLTTLEAAQEFRQQFNSKDGEEKTLGENETSQEGNENDNDLEL